MKIILPSLLGVALLATPLAAQQEVTTEVVVSGVGRPLLVTHAPGDFDRIFIVDQNGTIRIVKNGTLLAAPYLNLVGQISSSGERGLLGLAFHPDYDQNGWAFVNYTDPAGNTQVVRYTVDAGDPDLLDPLSKQTVLSIAQPYSNHNGGMLAFGPDGYLYIGTGDGGSAGDPGNRAQTISTLLGKMLRLDVDQLPYTSPPTNMGAQDPNMLDEIWALGLRNPWRYDFDKGTGDLLIADVGQNVYEEVHVVKAADYLNQTVSLNFGWRLMEGAHCYNPPVNCNPSGLLELPVFEYVHGGSPFRCSITGGYVYRGSEMATLAGTYYFGDYCSGELMSLVEGPAGTWNFQNLTAQSGSIGSVVGFGQDAAGEVYVCAFTTVRKIVPKGFRLDVPQLTAGQSATAFLADGTPGAQYGIGYSTVGLGATPVPQFGVTVDLANPQRLRVGTLNFAGGAAIVGNVPPGLSGTTLWLQAAEPGATTNVVRREVL